MIVNARVYSSVFYKPGTLNACYALHVILETNGYFSLTLLLVYGFGINALHVIYVDFIGYSIGIHSYTE